MINQQLSDFIKQQLLKGVDKETITKELLGNGWSEIDIKEGFNTVNTPVINQTINPVINPVAFSSINNPILTQTVNHSGKKVILIIVALFIIAGGVSGYYFRNYIPVIKDLIKNKDVTPVSEIKQEENKQEQNKELIGIIDCGKDMDCFIKEADQCHKTKVSIVKINEKTPMFDIGTIDIINNIEIIGVKDNNCISRIKIIDYKFKYNENGIAAMLSQGNTQEDIKKEELDNSKMMVGSGQICKIDSSKKIGEAINQLLSSSINLSMKCNNSICSYNNGLTCESFLQLNDNPNCKLETNVSEFEILKGVTPTISVSGFNGKESQVSWSVKDKGIVEISPLIGKNIQVKSLNTGSTDLIVTDNSIGKECFVVIPVKVSE